jgi:hypothetical protein
MKKNKNHRRILQQVEEYIEVKNISKDEEGKIVAINEN